MVDERDASNHPERMLVTRPHRVERLVRAEAPFLFLTTAAGAGPLVCLVAFLGDLNDKPGGFHPDARVYGKLLLVAAIAACLAAVTRRALGRPRTFEGQVFIPVLLGGLAVTAVNLTFCWWAGWAIGQPTGD